MCPCNKFPKNKIYDKHRLEVDSSSEKFLKMAKNRLDSGADLYYHRVHPWETTYKKQRIIQIIWVTVMS